MLDPRISIITLGVSDLAKSKEFYTKLGFPIAHDMETIVFFKLKNITFALYPKEKLLEDIGIKLGHSELDSESREKSISQKILHKAQNDRVVTSGIKQTYTLAYNVPSKEDVDTTIEFVRSLGGKIVKEPQDVFWGGYSSYFADPDGNCWEVAWNPEWTEF